MPNEGAKVPPKMGSFFFFFSFASAEGLTVREALNDLL